MKPSPKMPTQPGTVTSISVVSPLIGGTITNSGKISIAAASANSSGYLSVADWSNFNNKQDALTLTTIGTSGAATLVGSVLNIPQYSGGGPVVTNSNVLIDGGSFLLANQNTLIDGGAF